MQTTRLAKLQEHFNQLTGRYNQLIDDLEKAEQTQKQMAKREQYAIEAKELVVVVAQMTQANIGQHISDLVSLALASVWKRPYKFVIDFVQKRGNTEAELYFVDGENKFEPLTAGAGGNADIASLALRFALWTLSKSQPVFILDEPFRNLHGAAVNEKASEMLSELSKQLGLQIIMAASEEATIYAADKVFRLNRKGLIND